MVANRLGPDYGVFELGDRFSEALLGRPYRELSSGERADLARRFEHKVSGHDARPGARRPAPRLGTRLYHARGAGG